MTAIPRAPEPAEVDVLPMPLGPAPGFPVEQLPGAVAQYVTALASTGLPADFAAICSLGVMAGAIGGSASIRISQTWSERPALWLALVAETGYRKSPTLAEVRRPLDAIARAHWEAWLPEHAAWKALPAKERRITPEPRPIRLVTEDSTLEALAVVLAENESGVVMLVDELRVLLRGLGQYKSGGAVDRARLLSLWAGQPVTIDRVVRGIIHIPAPTLSVVGGIQPALLSELDGDDGLRERFLIAQADSSYRPPRMALDADHDDDKLRAARLGWEQLVYRLEAGRDRRRELILSTSGHRAFATANNRLMDLAESLEESAHVTAWARKAPAHLARLILVLAEASGAGIVDADQVEQAEQVIDYFAEHRRRLYLPQVNLMATPIEQARDRGVDKLIAALATTPDGRLTRREVSLRHIGGVRTADDVTRLLERYEASFPGCVRTEQTGRRPAEAIYHPDRRPQP